MEVHKTGTRKILEDDNKIRENFPLQHHKENEEMFMLGMYRALDGNNKDRFKYMQKKETVWETSIRVGGFQQKEAWKYLNSAIPQTIK